MAYTTPKTWAVGEVVTASNMNTNVRDNVAWLHGPPTCRAYNSANISINNDTLTALTFNSERWDTDDIHSVLSNTGRLTCKTAGVYTIYGTVRFATNDVGQRAVQVRLNGTTFIGGDTRVDATSAGGTRLTAFIEYKLAATDYVELVVYQNSGGALNVVAEGNYSPEFGMTRIAAG